MHLICTQNEVFVPRDKIDAHRISSCFTFNVNNADIFVAQNACVVLKRGYSRLLRENEATSR